jgi:hypothetical protein
MVAYPAPQGKAASYGGGNPPMAEEGVWGGRGDGGATRTPAA